MALFEDLADILNISQSLTRPSSTPASNFRGEAGSGLSGIANAGNRAMGEQEQALAILSRMSGQQKMELFGGPSGEYMSLEEEAADPRTGTANRIIYAMSKMMPTEEPTQFQPPMGSDTITIPELPPFPTETELKSIQTPVQTGGYYGEFAGTPGTGVGLNPVSDGRIPGKEILYEGYTPLSEPEAAALVSTVAVGGPELLAVAAIKYLGMAAPQAARMVANPATREQLRRGLTSMAEKAMGGTKQARDMTASARAAQLSKPHQQLGSAGALRSPTQKTMEAAKDFRAGFPGTGIYNAGGPIRRMGGGTMRDEILDRYNRMY